MSLTLVGHADLADGDHTRVQDLLADAASLFADTGNLMYLEGLAGAAAARGDCERAAELDGARDALCAQIGVLLPPVHPAGYAQTLAIVRAALTPAAFNAARGRHQRLNAAEADPAAFASQNWAIGAPPAVTR
jgi:hypothetical protein